MGSSGAYTVNVLKALALAKGMSTTPGRLAEQACEIEIDVLKEPVGKQDQYVSAHGGICAYTFNPDGSVDVEPLELVAETLPEPAQQLPALLHGRGAQRVEGPGRPGQRTEADDDDDAREPRPHEGDRATRAASCSSRGRPRRATAS